MNDVSQPEIFSYAAVWPPHLRIVPAQPLAKHQPAHGCSICELDAGRGGEQVVRPLTSFKSELDRRLVAAARQRSDETADPWLIDQGFAKTPSGRGVQGQRFVDWLFGSFWHYDEPLGTCFVPAWMCVGWNRKQRPTTSRAEALEVTRHLDGEALQQHSHECATGEWFAPFPLVLMGEGQNRVDLYAAHGLPILMRLRLAKVAPAESLTLQRIAGTTDLVALHCADPSFHRKGQASALLPFPQLAVPLLEAYGVRWARGRHVVTPCCTDLREHAQPPSNDPLPLIERWRPRSWRRMLLSQCYV